MRWLVRVGSVLRRKQSVDAKQIVDVGFAVVGECGCMNWGQTVHYESFEE